MSEQVKAANPSLIEKLEARLAEVRRHRDQRLADYNVALGQCHELERTIKDLREPAPIASLLPAPRLAVTKTQPLVPASTEAGRT